MQSEMIDKLAAALAKAQGQIRNAKKDASNKFANYTYSTLASVWDACREPLSVNGLAVVQTTKETDVGAVVLVTILTHSSGQWIDSEMKLRTAKVLKGGNLDENGQYTSQGIGSALTYARRYALAAMVGIAQDDDDGNGGTGGNGRKAQSHWSTDPVKQKQLDASLLNINVPLKALFEAHSVTGWDEMGKVASGKKAFITAKEWYTPARRFFDKINGLTDGYYRNYAQLQNVLPDKRLPNFDDQEAVKLATAAAVDWFNSKELSETQEPGQPER